MDKVYIVTSGEYSSYGIERVFLDKEHAEEYAKHCWGEVEEYEISDTNRDYKLHTFEYIDIRYIEYKDGTTYTWFNSEKSTSLDSDLVDYAIEYSEGENGKTINFQRVVSPDMKAWKLRDTMTKACQDMMGQIKYMRQVEQMSVEDVNVVLNRALNTRRMTNNGRTNVC